MEIVLSINSIKVFVAPKASNPYQDLLYAPLIRKGLVDVSYVKNGRLSFLTGYLRLFAYRIKGGKLVHIHWLYFLKVPLYGKLGLRLSYINCYIFMSLINLLDCRVVWTVHNILPHTQITSDDLSLRRKLAKQASVKIVHSRSTIELLRKHGISTASCIVIPHGNFNDVYPNTITKLSARKKLNIPVEANVVLSFGRIMPYKNIAALIRDFADIVRVDNNAYLLIAGKVSDPKVLSTYAVQSKKLGNSIRLYDNFIEDKDVQTFFNASDFVVLPFKEITTSSSGILATSFGKPIIAPRIGMFEDMPSGLGVLYNPKTKHALRDSVIKALAHKKELKEMTYEAKKYSASLSWKKIADRTYEVYGETLR